MSPYSSYRPSFAMQTPKDMWRPIEGQDQEEDFYVETIVENKEDMDVYTTDGPDADLD
eukprot:CAMPEP_0176374242 /NCGR_PEP_ID=MMETSP0126-20121128/26625_1 /TAXON_ID=141414 ORGANISM="Strombidinopsis acuminatum, Strain SPMC142" /NCGR_SAMPLE_ID=MMETSP0126 /ASSEMBLY_ACC=CAM_ASM_000229 /LENGTH=57 /DNA_ID=CAMNT_0017734749 /DNA_START=285 /DNA_END=458 /DNA_ORIENTATION=-